MFALEAIEAVSKRDEGYSTLGARKKRYMNYPALRCRCQPKSLPIIGTIPYLR